MTPNAEKSFLYDTNGAAKSNLVIYIGPSGMYAAAELGIAWANNVPILGLLSKGEAFGLMRKLVTKWCKNYTELFEEMNQLENKLL